RPPRTQRHEAQLLEHQLALRRQHYARGLAEAGQCRRRRRKRILDWLVANDLALDLPSLARIGRRGLHDSVDEQTKTAVGRDSPRGGVRVRQQPALLELLHHAADRRRRQVDRPGKHLRADRMPAFEIGLDHEPENLAHSVRKFPDRLGHAHASRIGRPAGLGTAPHQYQENARMRPSGRAPDQMRELRFEPGFTRHAEGSCLVSFGDTRVLCTASVEDKVPPFLRGKGQGWVTAEYGMLPRATHTRGNREAAKGKQSGRTQEIQRLIGRSLRAVVDLPKLGERQIIVDCDVIQADGGTRTASISGGWVALRIAIDKLLESKALSADPIRTQVAAVSCGFHNGTAVLDLDYDEDSQAGCDGNFVLTADGLVVEAQVTAEGECYDEEGLLRLLRLARIGCSEIFAAQLKAASKKSVEA